MGEELVDLIVELKEDEALKATKAKIDAAEDPIEIIELSRKAMKIVGDRFEAGEYMLPELVMAGEILKGISEIIKPKLIKADTKYIGKFILGTIEGDIHDIGKNVIKFLLEGNGFEVIDLGIDVPPEKFVETLKETGAPIIGMSALLSSGYPGMKKTVELIKEAGLRDKVKILIGGEPMDELVMEYTGADAWTRSGAEGVIIAKKWMGV